MGGHLVDSLVSDGSVTILDDLSTGKYHNEKAKLVKVDLAGKKTTEGLSLDTGSTFFHLAANPSVKDSMEDIVNHFHGDVTTTLNALELARKYDAKTFIFTSTSVVYGDAKKIPTPESYPTRPISNYGLFKLMGEHLVEKYSEDYGIKSTVFRIANVTGGRTSHGVTLDFINKLKQNKQKLVILGDGNQRKSYVYITDTINALRLAAKKIPNRFRVLNLGSNDYITVKEIADIICSEMGLSPTYEYDNKFDGRGWKGDVKIMLLETKRL